MTEVIDRINANTFLKEFSYSRNQFHPTPGKELEFADHVILLDDTLIVFQIKERAVIKSPSLQSEQKWFDNKVLNKSKKQIKDTIKYFKQFDHIEIVNQRNHKIDIKTEDIKSIIKIILYSPNNKLPRECYETKYYHSRDVGFIHIAPVHDYMNICRTFVTPIEIAEYFEFREHVMTHFPTFNDEKAIAGQYILGALDAVPNPEFSDYVDKLENDRKNFELLSLLHDFEDSIAYTIGQTDSKDYYLILKEFATLNRVERREIRKRMLKCIDECKEDRITIPFRMMSPKTGCGFVFLALEPDLLEYRINGLKNYTYASKYLFESDRHVGVSFVKVRDIFMIDWCYMEFPWQEDKHMESRLEKDNPFRETKYKSMPTYKFKSGD